MSANQISEKAILQAALDKRTEEVLAAYVEGVGAGAPGLRSRIQELLKLDKESDGLLDDPVGSKYFAESQLLCGRGFA